MSTRESVKHQFKDVTPDGIYLIRRLLNAAIDADHKGDHMLADLLTEAVKEIEKWRRPETGSDQPEQTQD